MTAMAKTPSASAACWRGDWWKPGTRFVEVVWPKVANSDNHSWDVHSGHQQADEEIKPRRCLTPACPHSSKTSTNAGC